MNKLKYLSAMEIYSPKSSNRNKFKLNQFKEEAEVKPEVNYTAVYGTNKKPRIEEKVYLREGSGYVERESFLEKTRRVFYEKLRDFFDKDEVI